MRIRILYDNEALPGFQSGWGFSCLLEMNNRKILFDTGRDGETLLSNMKKMGIRKKEIDAIVLSHEHSDHAGGLSHVLYPDVKVFLPASFPREIKDRIARKSSVGEVRDFTRIDEGIYTTGELGIDIIEQSLLAESESGLVLLTGCAHPGLENIIDFARRHGQVSCVIGGFHVFHRIDRLSDMRLISPCHCTSRKTDIHRVYPETSVECAVGKTIKI